MFSVKKIDDLYAIEFTGEPSQFADFISIVYKIDRSDRAQEGRIYYFSEKGYKRLYYMFSNYLPDVGALNPYKKSSDKKDQEKYKDICVDFNLEPYVYQKEAIYDASQKDNILYVLPCGAGKTVIGLGIFHELFKQEKIQGPALIVTKASLKEQWKREVEKFTDYSAHVIKTLSECKKDQAAFEEQFDSANILITNYEGVANKDIKPMLHKKKLEMMFLDEIHYVKSPTSKRSKSIHEFNYVKHKFGATASPVKKNPQDLFSIYKFINPEVFPSESNFNRIFVQYGGFGRIIGGKNKAMLNEKIEPHMFRKTSEEVNEFLPKELIIQRNYELSRRQQKSHDLIMEKIDEFREQEQNIRKKLTGKTNNPDNHPDLQKIEAMIMAHQSFAQQLCNDEKLLLNSESEMAKEFVTGDPSNKVKLMLDTLEEIIEAEENVVIFSKFASIQPILTDYITKLFNKNENTKHNKIAYIRGGMSTKQRYKEVYEKFRDDEDYKVLLASDAGAEGLNLSNCKYLIDFEPADSHATQTQRYGRITRADSTHKNVIVYKLIGHNTWDEIGQKIVSKKESYHSEIIEGA